MTDDSSNLVDIDLDTFSSTFFNPEKDDGVEKPEAETEDDALATEQTDENLEGDEHEEEQPEEQDDKPAKPGKKSAQERINEVVAKQREAERERDTLRIRLAELEAAATKKPEADAKPQEEPKPLREQLAADMPNPDATNEDGTPKYRLGEFDPQYIRDLTRYTINEERAKAEAEQAKVTERQQVEAAQRELQSSWEQKVGETEKELPDLREKLGTVEAAFTGIDAGYGEFLAATIMSCDHGPEIMYYLSQNIDEAKKIVASGPAAATLALGRLDAKFVKAGVKEEPRNRKPSSAPEPIPSHTRGAGGKFTTKGDTNDLAAFEREFYPPKK